jgi:SMI1 / KNR4 family (SUKH-1)
MGTSIMLTLPERLREKWVFEGAQIRPGARPEVISAFESRYGIALPSDLRCFYRIVDGMDRWYSDKDMLEFLHLDAVKSVPEELIHFRGIPDYGNIANTLPNAERYFVIADFMLSSNVFAIRLSDDASKETPVVVICGDSHTQIADSFTEFGEIYLQKGAYALL